MNVNLTIDGDIRIHSNILPRTSILMISNYKLRTREWQPACDQGERCHSERPYIGGRSIVRIKSEGNFRCHEELSTTPRDR